MSASRSGDGGNPSSVLLVDWLGRGGIAQTTEAWALELGGRGHAVEVVTRGERELGDGVVTVCGSPPGHGKLGAHRAVARTAVACTSASKARAAVNCFTASTRTSVLGFFSNSVSCGIAELPPLPISRTSFGRRSWAEVPWA